MVVALLQGCVLFKYASEKFWAKGRRKTRERFGFVDLVALDEFVPICLLGDSNGSFVVMVLLLLSRGASMAIAIALLLMSCPLFIGVAEPLHSV